MRKLWSTGVLIVLLLSQIPLVSALESGSNNQKEMMTGVQSNSLQDSFFDMSMRILQRLCKSPSLTVGCVKNESLVWYKSYGKSDLHPRRTPDEHTVYLVGSVTKTVTTTAFLQLYEQGMFDLDADINTYLPFSLRNPKYPDVPITFRMLLSHRSSIYDYCIYTVRGMVFTFLQSGIPDDIGVCIQNHLLPGGKYYTPEYWLDIPPGAEVHYSNIGFFILGYLFERISGESLESYCQAHIFDPLHMDNTSYHPERFSDSQMATPYIKPGIWYVGLPNYDAKALAPAGGLRTTLEDLSHFLVAHMNNGSYHGYQLLQPGTLALMHDCIYNASNQSFHKKYGLGWSYTFKKSWGLEGHGGLIPGGTAMMWMNQTQHIGFIILTNQFDLFGFFEKLDLGIKKNTLFTIGVLLLQKATQL